MFVGDDKQTFISLSMSFTTQAYWKYTKLWLHLRKTANTKMYIYNWLQFPPEMNTSGRKTPTILFFILLHKCFDEVDKING